MKKLLALLLALLMVVTLFACDSKNDRDDEDEDDTTISEEKDEEKDEAANEEEEEAVEEEEEEAVEEEEEAVKEEDSAVSAWVEENRETFLESMEASFATSSGMTCTSELEAVGNGVVVWININELDDLTDAQKESVQDTYDQMDATFVQILETLQLDEPAIESLTIHVCEGDGDLIATIYAEN